MQLPTGNLPMSIPKGIELASSAGQRTLATPYGVDEILSLARRFATLQSGRSDSDELSIVQPPTYGGAKIWDIPRLSVEIPTEL